MSKSITRAALRAAISAIGEPLLRPDALGVMRQRFGEHVCRVVGAQFLARHGIELILIQLFARWGFDSVLRYV